MSIRLTPLLLLGIALGEAVGADNTKRGCQLDDYILVSVKSEKELLSWARVKDLAGIERFQEDIKTERFEIGGKRLLVFLAARPMATTRMEIFVYVLTGEEGGGEGQGWGLLLHRYTGTSSVKVKADQSAKRLTFISKAGRILLILPIENVDLIPQLDEM